MFKIIKLSILVALLVFSFSAVEAKTDISKADVISYFHTQVHDLFLYLDNGGVVSSAPTQGFEGKINFLTIDERIDSEEEPVWYADNWNILMLSLSTNEGIELPSGDCGDPENVVYNANDIRAVLEHAFIGYILDGVRLGYELNADETDVIITDMEVGKIQPLLANDIEVDPNSGEEQTSPGLINTGCLRMIRAFGYYLEPGTLELGEHTLEVEVILPSLGIPLPTVIGSFTRTFDVE